MAPNSISFPILTSTCREDTLIIYTVKINVASLATHRQLREVVAERGEAVVGEESPDPLQSGDGGRYGVAGRWLQKARHGRLDRLGGEKWEDLDAQDHFLQGNSLDLGHRVLAEVVFETKICEEGEILNGL